MSHFPLSWFRRGRNVARPPARPRLESLEDRIAPAVLEVVGTGGNGTTTFDTFAQAYAASTSPGDVIQIEPNASVGSITLNDPGKALTVLGDENFGTENNTLTVGDVTIAVNGANLMHLDITGTVTVNAGFRGTTVADSQLGGFTETAGAGNGGNTLTHDDFQGTVTLQGGNTTSTASTGDQILHSVFKSGAQLLVGKPGAAVNGLTVSDTTFEETPTTAVVLTDSQNVSFDNVPITLTTAADAVVINDTTASLPVTGIQFSRADLRTLFGTGIHILVNTAGEQLGLTLQGVAFQGNTTAVSLTGAADLSPGSVIDAGGEGSVGGNEFNINVTTGILVDDAGITANHLSVFANDNAVGPGVTPIVVAAGSVAVTQGTNLSQDQTIVQGLYHNYLLHPGSVGELNFWANFLPTMGTQGVANAIQHSQEGLSNLVNQLFNELLGRDVDSLGQSVFVTQLNNGFTEEQVIEEIMASPEFAARANALFGTPGADPNLNFVHSLYFELLGRTGESAGEDNFWLAVLGAQGKGAVVTGFLASSEFRNDFVGVLYSDYSGLPADTIFGTAPDLLCRNNAPAMSETNFWAASTLDLLSIERDINASAEYAQGR